MAIKWMNNKLKAAAHDYAAAFAEACEEKKVERPLDALVNTDAYPRLQKIPTVEFSVGWLHGCAEAIGITVEELYTQLTEKKVRRAA